MGGTRLPFAWESFGPEQMRAALGRERNFVKLVALSSDQARFALDADSTRWRFLQLPSHHPVLIEQVQYFLAVTSAWAFGLWEPGTRSALTRFEWKTAPAAFHPGRPAWAEVRKSPIAEGLTALDMAVEDSTGELLFRARCIGHVFAGRDFLGWRAHAKAKALANRPALAFEPANAEDSGLPKGWKGFLSAPRQTTENTQFDALVTAQCGFIPSHPFHEGSGDHVNAAHLFDCALQAAHLLRRAADDKRWICESGEAQFQRFVELDVPFTLTTSSKPAADDCAWTLELSVTQLGQLTTSLQLRLRHPQD